MYGFSTTLREATFSEAVHRTTEALNQEGFGILSDFDVQGAMHDKLGVHRSAYRILGACNPPLADRALEAEPDVGLLLPCNVIVRGAPRKGIVVGLLTPQAIGQLTSMPGIQAVAAALGHRNGKDLES